MLHLLLSEKLAKNVISSQQDGRTNIKIHLNIDIHSNDSLKHDKSSKILSKYYDHFLVNAILFLKIR